LDSNLIVVAANNAYLKATRQRLEDVIGHCILEFFPDRPVYNGGNEVAMALASLKRVFHSKQADIMPVQRSDAPEASRTPRGHSSDAHHERYWKVVNLPILDGGGHVRWILQSLDEVTDSYRLRRRSRVGEPLTKTLRSLLSQMRRMNPILSDLDDRFFDLIMEHLKPVRLKVGDVLARADSPIEALHFLMEGYVSESNHLADGSSVDNAPASLLGIVGVSLLVGLDHPLTEATVRIGGSALRLEADVLRALMADNSQLRAALSAQAVPLLIAQLNTAATCNARHSLEQRLARWILTAHACAGESSFPITHEAIASMLGVRRASVTEGIKRLDRLGGVQNVRGRITVRDQRLLEAQSCACYRELLEQQKEIRGSHGPMAGNDWTKLRTLMDSYARAEASAQP
jgi:CRP-like cAMP-binding protein